MPVDILAEIGIEVGKGHVAPNQDIVQDGKGGGDRSGSRVGVERLICDTWVGREKLSAAAEGAITKISAELEGGGEGAVSGVKRASTSEESIALALGVGVGSTAWASVTDETAELGLALDVALALGKGAAAITTVDSHSEDKPAGGWGRAGSGGGRARGGCLS